MPRKKVKKSNSTKTVKNERQLKNLTASLEKTFRDMPTKIAIQTRKDLLALKQHEAKLQSSLQKLQKQQKTVNNKYALLAAKDNISMTAKKQLKAAKKSVDEINKTIANVVKQIEQTKHQSKLLVSKQAKYVAMKKHIQKLDKEWENQPAKVKKSISKPKKALEAESTTHEISKDESTTSIDVTPEIVDLAS